MGREEDRPEEEAGPETIDPGEPIAELRRQQMPAPDFVGKVRRRIHRRLTTSQFASYSWQVPKEVLIEFANVLGQMMKAFSSKKEP